MRYRDPDLSVEERVADLLPRMTLEEKAGLMFHTLAVIGDYPDGAHFPSLEEMVGERHMNHFNLYGTHAAGDIARWHNLLQERARATRLGIPVTLSTDPRHAFTQSAAASMRAGAFSQWPEPLGLAAIGDAALVRRHADIVRREYCAVGIRVALHPQIDLATEPRWSRISGTFGEDAALTSTLVTAYLEGLRGGPRLGPRSVAAMVKHFPGGGPQKDGLDPHYADGREQVYPGGRFDHHLEPFRVALAAGATQVMPYYGMPVGTDYEEVGFGFNRGVVTGLLRERLGFDGIVCTDWTLVTDRVVFGEAVPARAWGVEHLSPAERALKIIEAGADQLGGEHCTELVVELVRSGRVGEDRIDASVRRLLREKFTLGLFDHPYVDPDAAEEIVGNAVYRAEGAAAQRAAATLLKGPLPTGGASKVYAEGLAADLASWGVEAAGSPGAADLAVLRLDAPYERRSGWYESLFRGGRLDFPAERLAEILALLDAVPTVVVIGLDRPAVIPEIAERAAALVAVYGAGDDAVLDVVFGRATPRGRLPFQLPRSMAEVEAGRPDVPQESADPLFPFGAGL
ncbi:glycoside hydrolase family 3 protein [Nonomuraea mangrovi]|uniref:beta-glucosidase n=1 Tax=Nonomuraea mangrovi TaxID=2316207 RepID=A0ABW4T6C8_9ACTN